MAEITINREGRNRVRVSIVDESGKRITSETYPLSCQPINITRIARYLLPPNWETNKGI